MINNGEYMNKVILEGKMSSTPKLKQYTTGNCSISFMIDTGEKNSKEINRIVAWGQLAYDIDQYFKINDQISVEGKLVTRSWTDKVTNKKNYITEVVAYKVTIEVDQKSSINFTDDNVPF
jgi:single-strand DNA-binding protein